MQYRVPISYRKMCRVCHTIVTIQVNEVKFSGATVVTCPTCHNPVKFTGDYGVVEDGVRVDRWKERHD